MTADERKLLIRRLNDGWPQCEVCDAVIPYGRLESLPATTRCVNHSNEGKYIGVPLYAHKTACTVAMVKTDPTADDGLGESVHQLMRGYMRSR